MKEIPVRKIIASRKEPPFSESFSIRNVADLLSGTDMVQELHRHDFFFILALEKGKGDHEIDFTRYDVGDRSVFFMRPGQVHHLKLKAGSTGYLIGFQYDFYNPHDKISSGLLREASKKNHCRVDSSRFGKLYNILTDIFLEYTRKQERYPDVIKANLSVFFIELVRSRKSNDSRTDSKSPYAQERFDKFIELLETHIVSQKKVSDYAGMLNLSVYQLNAITKRSVGKTCSNVIDEYIILESKRHLLATSSQVNQIAYHLGYEDVSYFIRFFKKHTGHTPDAFRNNLR
jgi:AraC-like DNA-binding protein